MRDGEEASQNLRTSQSGRSFAGGYNCGMNEQDDGESISDDLEADLQRVGAILESIAARFPPDSEEALAIRDAALAYSVVRMHRAMKASYEKLRNAFDGELTEEMKAKLRYRGIDPDELEDDGPDTA